MLLTEEETTTAAGGECRIETHNHKLETYPRRTFCVKSWLSSAVVQFEFVLAEIGN